MNNNVQDILDGNNCYGCGVCASICIENAIKIIRNKEGFYIPVINNSLCVKCKKCIKVCSYNDNFIANKQVPHGFYAGYSLDKEILQTSTSGGLAYEISRFLIESGYIVCACGLNENLEYAEHYIATYPKDLLASKGSKYIPSYTLTAFKKLRNNVKTAVIGTPCQIDSIRRRIQIEKCDKNYVLIDFFCHGVPSLNLWNKYLTFLRKKIYGLKKVSWIDKSYGWHKSKRMKIEAYSSMNEYEIKKIEDNIFMRFFLANACLNKACTNRCKYKGNNSSADIRLGDFWGAKYNKNQDGISAIISFSEKGDFILEKISDRVKFTKETEDDMLSSQMKNCAKNHIMYPIVMFLLKTPIGINYINLFFKWINRLINIRSLIKLLLCKKRI